MMEKKMGKYPALHALHIGGRVDQISARRSVPVVGSYLRLIDCCIAQLWGKYRALHALHIGGRVDQLSARRSVEPQGRHFLGRDFSGYGVGSMPRFALYWGEVLSFRA